MTALTEKLSLYLAYPFVRYAIIAGILIALCASLLGVPLVLRRFSLIGDGLSHVAFGAMAIAAVLNLTHDLPLILAVTMVCAVLILRGGQKSRLNGDAVVAMLSVGSLAIGYLLMNRFSVSNNVAAAMAPKATWDRPSPMREKRRSTRGTPSREAHRAMRIPAKMA